MNRKQDHSHPDLDAVLEGVSSEETGRLREIWSLVGAEEPTDFPSPQTAARAVERLEASIDKRSNREEYADVHSSAEAYSAAHTNHDSNARFAATQNRRAVRWYAAVAAVVLLLIAGGLIWWLGPVTRTASSGEHLAIMLPDGSTVELNSGSTIRYSRSFGDVRRVYLKGEAFFDVVEGERSFVVHTFNAEICVTGTRFNVRARPGGLTPSTTVTLASGRVVLDPMGGQAGTVTMAPGETRRVLASTDSSAQIERVAISVAEATAWRRGDLVFINEPLGIILGEVERRFAVDLIVRPASLRQKRLSLALRRPADAEAVIRDISMALGLHYRETSTGFEIYAPTTL